MKFLKYLCLLPLVCNAANIATCNVSGCSVFEFKPKATVLPADYVLWCANGGIPRGSILPVCTSRQDIRFGSMQAGSWIYSIAGWYPLSEVPADDPAPPVASPPSQILYTGRKASCAPDIFSPELRKKTVNGRQLILWYCDNNPRGIEANSRIISSLQPTFDFKAFMASLPNLFFSRGDLLKLDSTYPWVNGTPETGGNDLNQFIGEARIRATVYNATASAIDAPLYLANTNGTQNTKSIGRVTLKDANGQPRECDIEKRLVTITNSIEKATDFYHVTGIEYEAGKPPYARCKLDGLVSK